MPAGSKRGLVAPQNTFLENIIRKTNQFENRKYSVEFVRVYIFCVFLPDKCYIFRHFECCHDVLICFFVQIGCVKL